MPAAIPAAIAAEHLKDFGFLLKDVSRLYSRNFERQSAALGLSLAQCRVLAHLEGVLCKRSRQARRDPQHFQRKVLPLALMGAPPRGGRASNPPAEESDTEVRP